MYTAFIDEIRGGWDFAPFNQFSSWDFRRFTSDTRLRGEEHAIGQVFLLVPFHVDMFSVDRLLMSPVATGKGFAHLPRWWCPNPTKCFSKIRRR